MNQVNEQLADLPPLVVLLGVTASGKSDLSMRLSRMHDAEIICADSRTVYRGMDIGTAKPSASELATVPHHIVNVINPDQYFTAAEFKRMALNAIIDISSRGRLPIMVGGTGLYIDGVIFDYAFLPPANSDEREYLQTLSIEQLQARIRDLNIAMPNNQRNPRHLIRTIETNGVVPVRGPLRRNTLLIGIDVDREVVLERIKKRVDNMVAAGLVDEVRELAGMYSWNSPGLSAPGYKAFRGYLEGAIDLERARQQFVVNDYQLARRQRTWFRRNQHINWVKNVSEAERLVINFLQK